MHLEETFIKTNEPKRICNVLFGASDTPDIAFKDCGMFLYNLAKDFNWQSTYVILKLEKQIQNGMSCFVLMLNLFVLEILAIIKNK